MRRLLVALAATAACDAGRAAHRHQRDPGTIVVARAADVIALDLARVSDSESIEVAELIFEGLVGWKPGTTELEPRLATSYEVSDDKLAWTFHLRDGVVFHDGTPLDADAVVFSFRRLLDRRHPNYLTSDDANFHRTLFKDVTEVVAVDKRTVKIRIARPYAPLLPDLAIFPIVSPAAVALYGDTFAQHPVGTGPFAFDHWTRGAEVVLARWDRYWGDRPGFDRIVFQVVADARQRLVDLESGSVDLASAIAPDEWTFVELHPDLVLHHTDGNNITYLAFNTQQPPFDDVRVRRACNLAVNKEPIVKLAYFGRAIAADGALTPTQWGYHAAATTYGYDPAAGKKLVDEAIADGTFDPNKLYTLYAPSTPRPYVAQPERVARFVQAALEQINVHTKLVLQQYSEHRAALEAGQHDMALFGWSADTGDPDNFLYVLFDSDNAIVGQAQNVAFYRDTGVDRLLREAQVEDAQARRSELYAQVQDKLAADAPWVPIAHSELVVASRASLEHVVLSPTGHPVYSLIRRRS
jgi:peptide/nickel transport system substrate-binding protein